MGIRPPMERVDADAVCARCSSINPEDTLICKVCGNNLRDQRLARLSREQKVEDLPDVGERRRWFSGIAAVAGAILVLLVLFNLELIERGLVEILAETDAATLGLWSGPTGEALNALAAELTSSPLTDEQVQAAMMSPVVVEDFAGRYVLAVRDEVDGLQPIGEAVVHKEDDQYTFVGRAGTAEVRGKAYVNNNGFLVADWGAAGYRLGSDEHQVRGAVGHGTDGGLECYGELDEHEASYDFLAYQVQSSLRQ